MPIQIIKKKLVPRDIKEIRKKRTLYLSEFRTLKEDTTYKLHDVLDYENYLPWIVRGVPLTVNYRHAQYEYPYRDLSELIDVPYEKDLRESIIKRLERFHFDFSAYDELWTPVAHEDIDRVAKRDGLKLNFSYRDFIHWNDKVKQKKYLKDLAPEFRVVRKIENLKKLADQDQYYLKRDIGAGGETTLRLDRALKGKLMKTLKKTPGYFWFIEKRVPGIPMSVQCYKNGQRITMFAYDRQLIQEGHIFAGAEFLPLEEMPDFLEVNIRETLKRLAPFIRRYHGFFGVDFMHDEKLMSYSVLEANVRMTDLSIPALLMNEAGHKTAEMYIDMKSSKQKRGDIILCPPPSNSRGNGDVLRLT